MSASDDLRAFIAPLLPGWRLQFGRWTDGAKSDRYAVLKRVGGLPAELVREPQFTLTLICAETDVASVGEAASDVVIEAMRTSSGTLVSMQAAEPAYFPTYDGRHVFEMAISAITT